MTKLNTKSWPNRRVSTSYYCYYYSQARAHLDSARLFQVSLSNIAVLISSALSKLLSLFRLSISVTAGLPMLMHPLIGWQSTSLDASFSECLTQWPVSFNLLKPTFDDTGGKLWNYSLLVNLSYQDTLNTICNILV